MNLGEVAVKGLLEEYNIPWECDRFRKIELVAGNHHRLLTVQRSQDYCYFKYSDLPIVISLLPEFFYDAPFSGRIGIHILFFSFLTPTSYTFSHQDLSRTQITRCGLFACQHLQACLPAPLQLVGILETCSSLC